MKSKNLLKKAPINKPTADSILMGIDDVTVWVAPEILLLIRKTQDHYQQLADKDIDLILKAYIGDVINEKSS